MGILEIQIISATNLPKKHLGKPSAYVVVKLETHRWATPAQFSCSNPVWNSTKRLAVINECNAQITFEVWHSSSFKDALIGMATTTIAGLTAGTPKNFRLQINNNKNCIAELNVRMEAVDFGAARECRSPLRAAPSINTTTNTTLQVNQRTEMRTPVAAQQRQFPPAAPTQVYPGAAYVQYPAASQPQQQQLPRNASFEPAASQQLSPFNYAAQYSPSFSPQSASVSPQASTPRYGAKMQVQAAGRPPIEFQPVFSPLLPPNQTR